MADTKEYLSGGRIQGRSDDTSGAVDALGSAADLDINSGSHPTGKRSNGYSVTSSQYAQAGGSSGSLSQFKFLHEPNCKWSISFWLKVASSGSGIADGKGIMGTADGATSEIGLSLKMNGTSSLLMHMRGSAYAARPASNNGCIPSDGNWHHYVMTHDHTLATTNTVLFKDGSAFTMQGADGGGNKESNSNSTSNHNNPFTIGGADTGEGGSFAFSIDDVSFYDRVLTSAEKVSLYNSGNSIDADDVSVVGLKAFWDMNESGDFINVTATDESKAGVTDVPAGTRYEETDTRKIFRRKLTPAFTHSQTSQNTQEALGHTNHLKSAQRIQAGHALIGKTITTCTFYMANSQSLSSGTVICELLESDGTLKAEIGTTNNSTISSSAGAVTFTGGVGGTVVADDMLALRTTGTDNSNYFALYHHTSSQDANSHWVDYQSGSWSNQTSKDLYFTATSAEAYSWVEKGTA